MAGPGGDAPDWMNFLLTEEQPLEVLELDTASGAFDDGALFEADALLGAPDLDSPCTWLQDSGESGLLCVDDSQGGYSNSTGAGSCGRLQGTVGIAAPTVPCGAAVPSTSQSTPSSWVAAPVGSLGAGGSNSQQHSDTGLGQNAAARDAADSSGRPGGSATQQPAGPQSEEELKRQARLQRNKENAKLSRQRKKAQVQGLEQRCSQLQAHNAQLGGLVTRLTTEVAALRYQLAVICQQAGRPMPHIPSALGPCMFPGGPLPGAQLPAGAVPRQALPPGAAPVLPPGVAPLPPPGVVPLPTPAPQPRQQLPAAAAAPAAAKAKQPAPAQAATAPNTDSRKRARTAAGSAFLALFTLFMFMSPFSSVPGASMGPQALPAALPTPTALAALPAGAEVEPVHRIGRALMQAADSGDSGGSTYQQQLAALPAAATTVVAADHEAQAVHDAHAQQGAPSGESAGSMGQLAALWNSTLATLMPTRQPPASAAQLEALALQRLQELAPVALLLDADDPSTLGTDAAHPLAVSQAFPQLADRLFASSGLRSPDTCAPVFELDASSLPAADRSRRSIERLLLQSLGMRGRSLLPAAAGDRTKPAPPAALPGSGHAVGVGKQQQQQQGVVIVAEDEEGAGWREMGGMWQRVHGREEEEANEQPSVLRLGSISTARQARGDASGPGLDLDGITAPALVSILLPANTSAKGGQPQSGMLASLSKIFVVMLYPRQRYVAYACSM